MAQSLQEFMANKGIKSPAIPTLNLPKTAKTITPQKVETYGGVKDFVKELPTSAGTVLRTIGKELMKPVGIVAKGAEAIGKATAGEFQAIKELPKATADIATGKKEYSFTSLWQENLPEHPVASTIIGTITDIVADPLNFVGGITTKGLNLAEKGVSKLPLFKGAKSVFSTKTGIKEFDTFVDQMKSLGEYKKAKVLEEARDIQKVVSKLPEGDVIKVSNYLEKGEKATDEINTLGEKLKTTYDNWKSVEKEMGIKGGEIAEYAPHIKAKVPLAESIKNYLSPAKVWSSKLGGAEKGRTIGKFISEDLTEQVGKAENLGLRKLNTEKLIEGIESRTAKTTQTLQEIQKRLAQPEIQIPMENWRLYLKNLRNNISENKTIVSELLDEPTKKEFGETIQSILNRENIELEKIAKELEADILTSQGKEFLYSPIGEKLSRKAKIVDLERKILKIQNEANEKISKLSYFNYTDKTGKLYRFEQASIEEIANTFNTKFFEENPAIQMAYRGLAHTKATTSKEFFEGVKKFASKEGLESTAPDLKGLKFEPDIAEKIDKYYQSIKPEDVKLIFKAYDSALNWWKGQALIAPSYHIRNMVGNMWNNFLAGVSNPVSYVRAGMLQAGKGNDIRIAGKTGKEIVELAEKRGVLGQGWFSADIPRMIESGIKSTWKEGINPLSQQNYAFKTNKAIGSAFENNARLAHFIDKLEKGSSVDDAVMSVKKYLFDYQDLTDFEKTWLKRVMPFYTWTRKNVPLQLEHLITQPGKYAGVEKVVRVIENIGMGNAPKADEKYLSEYIKGNTAMRVKYNEEDKTYYYFLLGNWLPAYQAMDFLSSPMENIMAMLTPLLKTPMEIATNKSSFFKNTLGDYETIERYPGQTTNYLGFNMPKRTATILRNIRLLNELDKLNPGKIFGGEKGEKSVQAKIGLPAVSIPLLGDISPAQYKYGKGETSPTPGERMTRFVTGKLTPYKVSEAKKYYQLDTQQRVEELQRAIKDASKQGDRERVKLLNEQLRSFQKERK